MRMNLSRPILARHLSSDSTKKSSDACLPSARKGGLPESPVPSQSSARSRKCGERPSRLLETRTGGDRLAGAGRGFASADIMCSLIRMGESARDDPPPVKGEPSGIARSHDQGWLGGSPSNHSVDKILHA